jgi:glycosyltransferase involved in cell wall biosynthesis
VNATFAGAPGVDARVVPNGLPDYDIDPASARGRLRELIGAPMDAEVVLQVGHLHPGKGQLELVEAAPELLAARPGARFAFVGADNRYEPEYGRRVRERAAELGVTGALTFLGHRDDAVELIAGADVLAVPSVPHAASGWREGFGLVAAEGMAVGTPVVAYAEDALVEVLGECGEIVPVGDRAALGRALARLLSDPSAADALRRCGRERARRFRLGDAAAAVAALYREAAS